MNSENTGQLFQFLVKKNWLKEANVEKQIVMYGCNKAIFTQNFCNNMALNYCPKWTHGDVAELWNFMWTASLEDKHFFCTLPSSCYPILLDPLVKENFTYCCVSNKSFRERTFAITIHTYSAQFHNTFCKRHQM